MRIKPAQTSAIDLHVHLEKTGSFVPNSFATTLKAPISTNVVAFLPAKILVANLTSVGSDQTAPVSLICAHSFSLYSYI